MAEGAASQRRRARSAQQERRRSRRRWRRRDPAIAADAPVSSRASQRPNAYRALAERISGSAACSTPPIDNFNRRGEARRARRRRRTKGWHRVWRDWGLPAARARRCPPGHLFRAGSRPSASKHLRHGHAGPRPVMTTHARPTRLASRLDAAGGVHLSTISAISSFVDGRLGHSHRHMPQGAGDRPGNDRPRATTWRSAFAASGTHGPGAARSSWTPAIGRAPSTTLASSIWRPAMTPAPERVRRGQ